MKPLNEELRMSLFLIVLATLCTLLLSWGNSLYQSALAEKEKFLRMEILRSLEIPFDEENFKEVFSREIEIEQEPDSTFYFYESDDETVHKAAVMTKGSGLWSEIELFLFLDLKAKVIDELQVISHGETPGLGGRIEEPWFQAQFAGLDISEGVKVVKEREDNPGEVDGITGASRTSESIELIVNRAVQGAFQEED